MGEEIDRGTLVWLLLSEIFPMTIRGCAMGIAMIMLWTVNAAMSTPRHATELLRTTAEVDPDMAVNIEHEDAAYDRLEGLSLAAENLRAAAAKL